MPPLPWRRRSEARPDQEYLVMASRLPLRSLRTVPSFLRLTLSVARQLERTDGLVGYSLLAKPLRKTFWTLDPLRLAEPGRPGRVRRQAAAPGVMRTLRPRMGPTKFVFWTVAGSALPVTWDEAIERLAGSPTTAP